MDFLTALNISASGLTAQRTHMNIISMNLANLNTTRTPEGGPYRKRTVIFAAEPQRGESFEEILKASFNNPLQKCRVVGVAESKVGLRRVFDPSHPDADPAGYVMLPNVNLMEEMVKMLTANRSYEANVTAINATKNMILKALEIGR